MTHESERRPVAGGAADQASNGEASRPTDINPGSDPAQAQGRPEKDGKVPPKKEPSWWEGQKSAQGLASVLFAEPGAVVEIRCLEVSGGYATHIASGYFDDPARFLAAARAIDGKAKGIYFTLNPVRPELLARANNRLVDKPGSTTHDGEVVHRCLLLIDADPVRPSGISSSDAEKAASFRMVQEVRDFLARQGFPDPLVADSGNGAHLLYRIDLPAADEGLVEGVLKALSFLFTNATVSIDTVVHNPARISKLYGTLVRKGDATADRPHRRSAVIEMPATLLPVDEAALRRVAAMAPKGDSGTRPAGGQSDRVEIDIDALLRAAGIEVAHTAPWNGGSKWILKQCPFNAEHQDRAAYVLRMASGALAAGCHHASCTGKDWHALRDIIQPGWRERQRGTPGSSGSGGNGAKRENWHVPQPISNELPPVLPFDFEHLPDSVKARVKDIAERTQCPPDFPAVSMMTGLGTVIGRKIGIRPKRMDDWQVVPNLFAAVIGRPGILKTPAIQDALTPLKRLEMKAKEDFAAAMKDYVAAMLVAKAKKKQQDESIRDDIDSGGDGLLKAKEFMAGAPEPPIRKRYLINDSTVEKLGELLNQNPNGVLCYRDELIGLLKSLDKEGQEGARSFYLEAWNGTGRYTYDRIARGTVDIEAAIVSVIGAIQPGPLGNYLRHAVGQTNQDDGLMQRFQLAVWPDVSKTWKNFDCWPNKEAREAVQAVFDRLANLDPDQVGAERDKHDADGIPFLRFSWEAQDEFDAWREALERKVRSGEEHPAIESHLAKYRSLVPSLALIIHLADGSFGAVDVGPLRKAIAWAVYLESHARRIYAFAVNGEVDAARALSIKIQKRELKDGFALRDVYRHGWSQLQNRDAAAKAVAFLIDYDWLVEVREETGGAPKKTYWINPRVWEKPPAPTDRTDGSLPRDEATADFATDNSAEVPPTSTDKTDESTPDPASESDLADGVSAGTPQTATDKTDNTPEPDGSGGIDSTSPGASGAAEPSDGDWGEV